MINSRIIKWHDISLTWFMMDFVYFWLPLLKPAAYAFSISEHPLELNTLFPGGGARGRIGEDHITDMVGWDSLLGEKTFFLAFFIESFRGLRIFFLHTKNSMSGSMDKNDFRSTSKKYFLLKTKYFFYNRTFSFIFQHVWQKPQR